MNTPPRVTQARARALISCGGLAVCLVLSFIGLAGAKNFQQALGALLCGFSVGVLVLQALNDIRCLRAAERDHAASEKPPIDRARSS